MQPSSPGVTAPYVSESIENPSCGSAISWPAIWGGVSVLVGLSLALFVLGGGLGLASVSPWADHGLSAKHFTYWAAVWLIIVQWVCSGIGGYVTGRLRTKWVNTHTHEVFFRDTAHGLITWTTATAISAVILLLAGSMATGGNLHALGRGASSAAAGEALLNDSDTLLRNPATNAVADQDTRAEVTRLLAKGLKENAMSDADKAYLSQLVAARAGLAPPDAQAQVNQVLTQERQAADQARKTASTVAIFSFLSMLIGAFIASAAAALGGRERDEAPWPGVRSL